MPATVAVSVEVDGDAGDDLSEFEAIGWDAWYDADDPATIIQNVGVSTVINKGLLAGFNLVQDVNSSYEPTLQTGGPNGRSFVRNDGTDDFLFADSPAPGWTEQPFTAAGAVVPTRTSVPGTFIDCTFDRVIGRSQNLVDFTSGTTLRAFAGSVLNNTNSDPDAWQVFVVVFDGANSSLYIADPTGVTVSTGDAGTGYESISGTNEGVMLGAAQTHVGDGANAWSDSDWGEIVVKKAVLTPNQITNVVIPHLRTRWIV